MTEQTANQVFEAALRHHRKGETREAETLYRRALALSPDLADAHNNLGALLHDQGRMEEALACYLAALRVDRHIPHHYGNLANLLAAMEWPDEAAFAYGRAADLMRKRGNWTGAMQSYERALAMSPSDFYMRFRLGLALLRLNRHAEASSQFGRVLASVGDLANYARFVAEGSSVAEVKIDGKILRFRVGQTANNVGVDICHVNGRLYEQEELAYCRAKVRPRAAIVDVGANTGNHLVYFASFLDPTVIFPVEFLPEAVNQLRENIELNRITCVDDRCLGVGAGDRHGNFSLIDDVDWAQARLVPSVSGTVKVAPLDDLVAAPVGFIKVDAEGMEIEVLNGARKLIAASRPHLLIEVQNGNAESFRSLSSELGYAVDRSFGHGDYSNCFLVPRA